ncbi:hypothetical protein NTGZN8_140002 [Candidatus Nitrotoga fabula]|uniref:Uncharacterized protein n=1 Tax=Candidatus Nitrotoga fabula TaxID=2182327 RepID=A0A916F8A5_9PROT|nr:hypothetical protein NTGZN8_140002 [Candidatus Nitrotoga fabula]
MTEHLDINFIRISNIVPKRHDYVHSHNRQLFNLKNHSQMSHGSLSPGLRLIGCMGL